MRSLILTWLFATLISLSGMGIANGAPTFATYVDGSSGSVNGINFSLSTLSNPAFGAEIQSLDLSAADWNSVGAQSGRIYNQNNTSSFTITFASPISNLELYLYYFRGSAAGGGGFSSYTFSESFTVTGGLAGVGVTGNTLDTSTVNFASGVLTFDGPISTLTISSPGQATGGDAGFTLAQAPIAQHTITFDSAGGSAVSAITQDVGSAITEPTPPTREGYIFTGWLPSLPSTMPDEDLTVTAQWQIEEPPMPVPSVSQQGLIALMLLIVAIAMIALRSEL